MTKNKFTRKDDDISDTEIICTLQKKIKKLINRNCILEEIINDNKQDIIRDQETASFLSRRLKRPYFDINEFLKKHGLKRNDLKKLTERERRILKSRSNAWSLEDIAEGENITRERVRQIEAEALRKLGLSQYFLSSGRGRSPFVRRNK